MQFSIVTHPNLQFQSFQSSKLTQFSIVTHPNFQFQNFQFFKVTQFFNSNAPQPSVQNFPFFKSNAIFQINAVFQSNAVFKVVQKFSNKRTPMQTFKSNAVPMWSIQHALYQGNFFWTRTSRRIKKVDNPVQQTDHCQQIKQVTKQIRKITNQLKQIHSDYYIFIQKTTFNNHTILQLDEHSFNIHTISPRLPQF